MMQVEYIERGNRLIAQPQGRMEAADGDGFAAEVGRRLGDGVEGLSIDLGGLEFINFGGVRALLRLARHLKSTGHSLDFIGGGEGVRYTLDQAGLDDFFPFDPPYISNRGTRDGIQ